MLPDPINVDANGSIHNALQLSLIRTDGYGSERRDLTESGIGLVINHSTGKTGNRHYVKYTYTVLAENPITGKTEPVTGSVSLAISQPVHGLTDAHMANFYQALVDTIESDDVGGIASILAFQS